MKETATKICVPVCARQADDLVSVVARAREFADVIELRLDCLDRIEETPEVLLRALNSRQRSLIVTLRSAEQGGHNASDFESRRRFWLSIKNVPTDALFDLEFDLVSSLSEQGPTLDWNRVICSHHDFDRVPNDLEEIYTRMAATPAAIIKIAVQANDATDCLPVFRLLAQAQNKGRELIAIAMGQAGIMTRILGPSRGSFLTYGSLDDESATAPGQVTTRELRETYRIDRIDRNTAIYGIVGNPVGHSWSPRIHNAAFASLGLNAVYIPFETRDVSQFFPRMVHPKSRQLEWNLRGLSVTAPHKQIVMTHLDSIDPVAKEIGAVNTIVVKDDKLHGYNTDAEGFVMPLHDKFGALSRARCAVIGAGGAARAIISALRHDAAEVTVFARNRERLAALTREFKVNGCDFSNADFSCFEIVVNATPLGARGEHEDESPAAAEQLRGVRLAYDLVYNPIETRFLRAAREAGCETISGVEMLLAQASEQFKLWIGEQPDRRVMREAAMRALD